MLLTDLSSIGNRLLSIRKERHMTQTEVARAANISGRAYADIERGAVNMRVETMLKLCQVLQITPNDLFLTECESLTFRQHHFLQMLGEHSAESKKAAYEILSEALELLKP